MFRSSWEWETGDTTNWTEELFLTLNPPEVPQLLVRWLRSLRLPRPKYLEDLKLRKAAVDHEGMNQWSDWEQWEEKHKRKIDEWSYYPWGCQIVTICFDWHAQISKKDLLENAEDISRLHDGRWAFIAGMEMADRGGSWNDGKHRIRSHVITKMLTMVLRPSLTSRGISMAGKKKGEGRKGQIVWLPHFPPSSSSASIYLYLCRFW